MDYRPALYGRGGIAVYTRDLAAALAAARPDDTFVLYGRRLRRRVRTPYGLGTPHRENVELLQGRFPSRALHWLARAGLGLDRICRGLDLLHWTDYTTLPPGRAPVVATIHDVLFDRLPDCYTADMRNGLRRTTRRIVDQARHLIVPSTRTAADLATYYDVDAARVTVVPHGHRALPSEGPREVAAPYVLFVGTLEPRKNLARLLDAFDRIAGEHAGLRLVVAGARGWLDDDIHARLVAHPACDVLGAVGPDRLGALYRYADVVAYPSIGEGFGLPVLEALSQGRPLLVGADTTCADIAGDAALAVDPTSVDALADGLDRLLRDAGLQLRLAAAGPGHAAAFTWAKAARATWAVYESVLQVGVPA